MANKTKRCKFCKEWVEVASGEQFRAGFFCCYDHAISFANNKTIKQRSVEQKRAKVATKKEKTKELRTRSQWYARLRIVVNQYVRWRDRGEPCCTCGTTNPNIKYDAGHFHTVAARPDIMFELTNIHKQCSQKCNVFGAGMRNEYEKFIEGKYGSDHIQWLKEVKPPLKEVFPGWQDIEEEIKRYRKLLRSVGLKPNI